MNKWQEDKFDREIRWLFFLNLRHENEGTKEAVIKAVNPTIDPLSYQYEDLWRAIMGKVNHLRGHTTNYLKVHMITSSPRTHSYMIGTCHNNQLHAVANLSFHRPT